MPSFNISAGNVLNVISGKRNHQAANTYYVVMHTIGMTKTNYKAVSLKYYKIPV